METKEIYLVTYNDDGNSFSRNRTTNNIFFLYFNAEIQGAKTISDFEGMTSKSSRVGLFQLKLFHFSQILGLTAIVACRETYSEQTHVRHFR